MNSGENDTNGAMAKSPLTTRFQEEFMYRNIVAV